MSRPTLETLLLDEFELNAARTKIEEMAYFKWLDAGHPIGNSLRFWRQAEKEWIEFYYVPHRDDL